MFKFFGIPTRLDISSVILFFLAYTIGTSRAPEALSPTLVIAFGVLVVAGLVFSILFHERAHIYAASRYGIECRGITIIALGGIATLGGLGKRPKEHFWIAFAGPLGSYALVIVCYASLFGLSYMPEMTATAFVERYLSLMLVINFMFGTFNLFLPIYPLDGGRILFSALWAIMKDFDRAHALIGKISKTLIVLVLSWLGIEFILGRLNMFSLIWYGVMGLLLWKMQNAEKKLPPPRR